MVVIITMILFLEFASRIIVLTKSKPKLGGYLNLIISFSALSDLNSMSSLKCTDLKVYGMYRALN